MQRQEGHDRKCGDEARNMIWKDVNLCVLNISNHLDPEWTNPSCSNLFVCFLYYIYHLAPIDENMWIQNGYNDSHKMMAIKGRIVSLSFHMP